MANSKKIDIQVFGAGLPRTGTMSLKFALEMLYEGDTCLHMIDVATKGLAYDLYRMFNSDIPDEEWKRYFEGHSAVAVCDIPFICIWERMMTMYPNAKVILTVREPETWVESVKNTLCLVNGKNGIMNKFPQNLILKFFPYKGNIGDRLLRSLPLFMDIVNSVEDGKGVEFYNEWVEHVKRTVPADRLLVFSAKEGWAPLCAFLNKPIPDQPYPRSNSSTAFQQRAIPHRKISTVKFVSGLAFIPLITLLIGNYVLKKNGRRSLYDSFMNGFRVLKNTFANHLIK